MKVERKAAEALGTGLLCDLCCGGAEADCVLESVVTTPNHRRHEQSRRVHGLHPETGELRLRPEVDPVSTLRGLVVSLAAMANVFAAELKMGPGVFGGILLGASIGATLLCLSIALWCPWWPLLFVYVPGTAIAWFLTYYTWSWARD